MTDERKQQILNQASFFMVVDINERDGCNISRLPDLTDEEWNWLYNGYHNQKRIEHMKIREKKLKRIL